MQRRYELDTLRGLLLILMTLTHLPTRLSAYSSQAFGFVSAAEGFVFLSGLVAGMVYWRAIDWRGEDWMRTRLRERVAPAIQQSLRGNACQRAGVAVVAATARGGCDEVLHAEKRRQGQHG